MINLMNDECPYNFVFPQKVENDKKNGPRRRPIKRAVWSFHMEKRGMKESTLF